MHAAYIAVTVVAAVVYAYAAFLSFTRDKSVIRVAETVHAPPSWMIPLGFLLGAGSVGLLTGFAITALGTAAGCGLVLYFIGAAGAHLRVRDTRLVNWINWSAFFSLAAATLAVGLAYHGPS
jgi:hypothetical protein